jgi:hypothetical protein
MGVAHFFSPPAGGAGGRWDAGPFDFTLCGPDTGLAGGSRPNLSLSSLDLTIRILSNSSRFDMKGLHSKTLGLSSWR